MSKKQRRFVKIVCFILALLMILSVLTYVISSRVHAVMQQQIQTLVVAYQPKEQIIVNCGIQAKGFHRLCFATKGTVMVIQGVGGICHGLCLVECLELSYHRLRHRQKAIYTPDEILCKDLVAGLVEIGRASCRERVFLTV